MGSDADTERMLAELRQQTNNALAAASQATTAAAGNARRLDIMEQVLKNRINPALSLLQEHDEKLRELDKKTQKLAVMFNQNMNTMADKGEEDLRTLLERIGAVEEKEKRVDTFSNDELKQKLAAVEDDHIAVIELQLQMETYKQEIDELRTSSVSRQNQEWLPPGNSGGTTASHNSDSPIGQASEFRRDRNSDDVRGRNPDDARRAPESSWSSFGVVEASEVPISALPKRPITKEKRDNMKLTQSDLFYYRPRDNVKFHGLKEGSPPMLNNDNHLLWKEQIIGYLVNLVEDGRLATIMMGIRAYENQQLQAKANDKIYTVMLLSTSSIIKYSLIPIKIRNERDGVSLSRYVYDKLEAVTRDRVDELHHQFHQSDPLFTEPSKIAEAIETKLKMADEHDDLVNTDQDQHAMSEMHICKTLLGLLPRNETWRYVRDHFDLKGSSAYNREYLDKKVRERLQEQFDPKELRGYEAEQVNVVDLIEANAAWKKNTGKYPRGYKDPEYLRSSFKGQQMDEQTKIKRLIEYLNTLERAPKLQFEDFKKFMRFADQVGASYAEANALLEACCANADEQDDELHGGIAIGDDEKSLSAESSDLSDDEAHLVCDDDEWDAEFAAYTATLAKKGKDHFKHMMADKLFGMAENGDKAAQYAVKYGGMGFSWDLRS